MPMDLAITDDPRRGGALLPVKVSAGAAREGVTGVHDGRLKVSVRTAPEKGKANKAVLALLAKTLGIPRRDLEITSGATSPRKTIAVRGLTRQDVLDRIGPHSSRREDRP